MVSSLLALSFPILHAGEADPTGWLHRDWSVQPTVVVGLFGLVVAYLAWTGPLNRRRPGAEDRPVTGGQTATFLAGAAVLLVALGPPLDDWADHYLLSAHMVQHLLLTVVVPPLLLLGTPGWVLEPLLRWRAVARVGYVLTRPIVALAVPGLVFALWHVPVLYEAALRREPVHILEHQVFLVMGLLAWWPVVGPLPAWPRLSPPQQCLYLIAQTIPGGIVGSIITLAEPGLYAPYDTARRIFGLGLATDQELAGLLMWVGSSAAYFGLVTVIFFRWAANEEAKDRATSRQPSAVGRPRSVPGGS